MVGSGAGDRGDAGVGVFAGCGVCAAACGRAETFGGWGWEWEFAILGWADGGMGGAPCGGCMVDGVVVCAVEEAVEVGGYEDAVYRGG